MNHYKDKKLVSIINYNVACVCFLQIATLPSHCGVKVRHSCHSKVISCPAGLQRYSSKFQSGSLITAKKIKKQAIEIDFFAVIRNLNKKATAKIIIDCKILKFSKNSICIYLKSAFNSVASFGSILPAKTKLNCLRLKAPSKRSFSSSVSGFI